MNHSSSFTIYFNLAFQNWYYLLILDIKTIKKCIISIFQQIIKVFLVLTSRSIIWNTRNNYGRPVSAGIYFYHLQTNDFVKTKKMVLLKQLDVGKTFDIFYQNEIIAWFNFITLSKNNTFYCLQYRRCQSNQSSSFDTHGFVFGEPNQAESNLFECSMRWNQRN